MKKESKGKGSVITGKLLGEIFHTLLLILSRAATNDFAVFLEEAHALAFAVFLEETHALAFAKEEARALAFAVFASFLRRCCKSSSEILFLRNNGNICGVRDKKISRPIERMQVVAFECANDLAGCSKLG